MVYHSFVHSFKCNHKDSILMVIAQDRLQTYCNGPGLVRAAGNPEFAFWTSHISLSLLYQPLFCRHFAPYPQAQFLPIVADSRFSGFSQDRYSVSDCRYSTSKIYRNNIGLVVTRDLDTGLS
jgi:hypothetical protein